ncbi:unnamed protein product [Schistosoma margrebowiei]|uniref:C3H1-type domain-containing protein n=1 Tax=Schistosoma margrebowiei TaxID=48269 RepID=A0A3P8GUK5_9TREM|nr:unnamed protein product [Schistosoma margrebowiei]
MKLTLNQINTCLVEENDQLKCSDLLNLKKDLEELIELKENELLNSEIGSILTDNQEKDDELQGISLQTDSSTNNEESLVGQRCSVPGWTSSGKFIRQNALILSVVDHDGDSPDRVRVLLAHPTRLSEVPCGRFFETGNCHRGIRCTRSHGKIFNIEKSHLERWLILAHLGYWLISLTITHTGWVKAEYINLCLVNNMY